MREKKKGVVKIKGGHGEIGDMQVKCSSSNEKIMRKGSNKEKAMEK